MRFRDFVATVIISTCTCLLVVWALIGAGIIQTQQQTPQQQPQIIKQTHTGTLIGTLNQTSGEYEAYITKIPIQNVTNKVSIRILHIYLETKIVNYDQNKMLDISYFRLVDQNLQIIINEKTLHFESDYAFLTIDISVIPVNVHHLTLKTMGTYNFTLNYNLVIAQETFIE